MSTRKDCNFFDGFSLEELMSENGLTFDIGNEFEDDEIGRPFNPAVNLSGDTLLREINMQEFFEGEDGDDNMDVPLSLGLNFEKIKEKLQDLTPDGKVKKLTRQNGVGDVVPQDALVSVEYSGYFEGQDEPYDSTYSRGTIDRYHLNQGNLLYGLDLAIQSMKKHEIAIFWIDQSYAYGRLGCPPLVPPGADVMFIVSLVDFLDSGSVNNFENLTSEQKKSYANVKAQVLSLFKIASDSFKRKKYKQAIKDYKRIINRLEDAELEDEEEEEDMQKSLSKARQNIAICYDKENLPRLACIECQAAVHKTAKIHFHQGRALIKMGEYKDALVHLDLCLKKDPGNPAAIKEMKLANELQKKYAAMEKKMWSKCLFRTGVEGRNDEEDSSTKLAKEFVTTFIDDKAVLRQAIPSAISPQVSKLISEFASASGLNVSCKNRLNKETKYLIKPEYS